MLNALQSKGSATHILKIGGTTCAQRINRKVVHKFC